MRYYVCPIHSTHLSESIVMKHGVPDVNSDVPEQRWWFMIDKGVLLIVNKEKKERKA